MSDENNISEKQTITEKILFGQVCDKTPGKCIENKDTILQDLDNTINSKPPDIEYILVQPFATWKIPFTNYGICFNTFGHSSIRYTMPDGEQKVMNIHGKMDGKNMVHFHKPEDFFFNTDATKTSPQGGLYNRNMTGIRLHDVEPEKIIAIDNYFHKIKKDYENGKNNFFIFPFQFPQWFTRSRFIKNVEYGNCAKWISQGLYEAKIINRSSYYPKSIWINIFENYDSDKINVIFYRRIKHAPLKYGIDYIPINQVSPLQTLRSYCYYNLEKFASRIIEVPEGSHKAEIIFRDDYLKPSQIRNIVNSKLLMYASGIGTAYGLYRLGYITKKNIMKNKTFMVTGGSLLLFGNYIKNKYF